MLLSLVVVVTYQIKVSSSQLHWLKYLRVVTMALLKQKKKAKRMTLRWWYFSFLLFLPLQQASTSTLWRCCANKVWNLPTRCQVFSWVSLQIPWYIAFIKSFCFIGINFILKMLPEKWKLEVSIKFRTNSNLPAFLCVYHQMRILQTLV